MIAHLSPVVAVTVGVDGRVVAQLLDPEQIEAALHPKVPVAKQF